MADLKLYILRMFKSTFSLDAAHFMQICKRKRVYYRQLIIGKGNAVNIVLSAEKGDKNLFLLGPLGAIFSD